MPSKFQIVEPWVKIKVRDVVWNKLNRNSNNVHVSHSKKVHYADIKKKQYIYIYIIKLKELRSFCNTETETETQQPVTDTSRYRRTHAHAH